MTRGPRPKLPSYALEKAAYLASERISQKQIAGLLGVSAATASRLVESAKKAGILTVPSPVHELDPALVLKIKSELYGRGDLLPQLQRRSNNTLKDLQVFGDTAISAAKYVIDNRFLGAEFVGVTWGQTIRAVAGAIRDMATRRVESFDQLPEFVQVCGDIQDAAANPSLRSSTLVADLNRSLGRSQNSPYNFSVSASIPAQFAGDDLDVIRKFIHEVGGYKKVFSSHAKGGHRLSKELDEKMGALLTSCGNGRKSDDRWLSECARIAKIEPKELEALTVGNIGGYWLPSDELNESQRAELAKINARWNGIVLEDIRRISQRGGVILVAVEDYKAGIVLRLVRDGLVSRLLISDQLEARIRELLATSG